MKEYPTQEQLRTLFYYQDGSLIRKVSKTHNTKVGEKVGYPNGSGYLTVSIKKTKYYLHRLIWIYHYGSLFDFIDHINGDKTDNRIENLREATNQQNTWNRGKSKSNTTGYKNVYLTSSGKYNARGYKDYTYVNLGTYDTIEEANFIATKWRKKNHEGFAN
jgi:hypothetical protein